MMGHIQEYFFNFYNTARTGSIYPCSPFNVLSLVYLYAYAEQFKPQYVKITQ